MQSEWNVARGSAGGCPDGKNPAKDNTQWALTVEQPTHCFIRLYQSALPVDTSATAAADSKSDAAAAVSGRAVYHPMAFFVLAHGGQRVEAIRGQKSLLARSGPFKNTREVSWEGKLGASDAPYTLLPCLHKAGLSAAYEVVIHSERPVRLTRLDPTTVEAQIAY